MRPLYTSEYGSEVSAIRTLFDVCETGSSELQSEGGMSVDNGWNRTQNGGGACATTTANTNDDSFASGVAHPQVCRQRPG